MRLLRYPRFADENFDKNLALVDRIKSIAARRGVKAGQLALAWVLAKGDDLIPIPGTKRRKYLEENAAAAEIKLTPGEVAELEAAIPENEIAGDRYGAAHMTAIDRLWEEVAYVAYYLHWSLDQILDLEHPTRGRVIEEIGNIHQRVGG